MKKIKSMFFYCIPILLLFFSFTTVFGNTIWVDEAYSLELAKHSMIDLIKIDSLDVHPPLYYMILRIGYLIFGGVWDYIWIGKFISLVPYIIIVLIGFVFVRKQFGSTIAFLFNIFVIGMPQMSVYSTEIRMYSWGMIFVFCAFLQFAKILTAKGDTRKEFYFLTIFSTFAAYTHYFACAASIVIYFELLLISLARKKYSRIKKIIISGLCVIILYLPWIFIFIDQTKSVKDSYWIPPVTLETIKENLLFLFETKSIIEVLILLLVILAVTESFKLFLKKEDDVPLCGIGVWAGTILMGIVLSLLIRPIFVSRYIMGASACFWFGIAVALSKIDICRLKYYIIIISSLICISVSFLYVRDEFRNEQKLDETFQVLNKNINDSTRIISDYNHVFGVVSYYYPKNESILVGADLSELTKKIFASCNLNRVNTVNDLDVDSLSNVLVLDRYGKIHKELSSKVDSIEYLGNFQIDWYQFDVYYIGAEHR